MSFSLFRTHLFNNDLHDFAIYCSDYSKEFALNQIRGINIRIETIQKTPKLYSYFIHTGEPYRASLFKIGVKLQYWIIYRIDENTNRIILLRFWNALQNNKNIKLI